MESPSLILCVILAVPAVFLSVVLALQTWEHRRFARSCMRRLDRGGASGRVAVFAPCKGLDVALEENLRKLLRQDYPNYEVTFIVESAHDPAVEVIRRVMSEDPDVATRLVVAGRATHSGQKVHNLRVATAHLSPEIEYLAFVDSDAGPRREWLRLLLAVLSQGEHAAVTGYRWYVPTRASMANHLLYSINCGIMALLGRDSRCLVWGGSWALRREVFDSIDLHRAWEGTLSDDLVATRMLRRHRCSVRFEPACVVASPLDHSMRQMFSFVRRQYLVGKFYAPNWWLFAVISSTLTAIVWLGNLAALAFGLASGNPPVWLPGAACALLYGLTVVRGIMRQDLVRTYFPDRVAALRKARRFDVWLAPVGSMVHWLGVASSMFGFHITWRGIRYRVFPGGQIRIVSRETEPPLLPFDEQRHDRSDVSIPTPQPHRPQSYRKAG